MINTFFFLCMLIVSASGRQKIKKDKRDMDLVKDYQKKDWLTLTEKYDGSYYQCDKGCMIGLGDDKCGTCFVDEDASRLPVFCEEAMLTLPCRNRCCTEITDPSNTRMGGLDEIKDYEKHDDEEILLVAFYCKKKCIAKKDACSSCEIDADLGVWCDDGVLVSDCVGECCDMA